MSQETRKDPRAKVLTMTVRYKSATLDEFIEHHSYDISRGGMFIKTPSPFPPGTLLKFEVKIADEQKLLQGVGRVVWKREKAGGEESPAGMGVKFIKINEEAQSLILDLTGRRPTAGAFEAGGGDVDVDSLPAPSAPPGAGPSGPRKATMLGLGSIAGAAEGLEASDKSANFFPNTGSSESDMPAPEDRTVMKQTAELLRDALREAGGSEEELGQNTASDSKGEMAAGEANPEAPKAEPKREKHVSQPPASRRAQSRDGHRRSNRPPATNLNSTVPPARPRRVAPAATAPAAAPEREDNGMARLGIIVAALVAVGGIIWLVTKPPSPPASAPPTIPVAQAPAAPEPPAPTTAAPVVSAAPQPAAPASAVSAAPSASSAPTASPPPIAAPTPKPTPTAPVATAKPTATTPVATAKPTGTAPSASATPTVAEPPAAAAPKKPKKAKPAEDSDNPY